MNEFIEECRREWQRLGVPDPVANEMAADLTADIEEAESEGGSAEDVLGDSLFDPRRFAAAWASARGVSATSVPAPIEREGLLKARRRRWQRPFAALAFAAAVVFVGLVAAAGAVGRHSAAIAAPVQRISGMPGFRVVGPGVASPSFRYSVPGVSIFAQSTDPLTVVAFVVIVVLAIALGLAVIFWSPWFRGGPSRGRP
jgi:hypothetical protein